MSKAFKKAVSAILGLTLCAGMCACNQTQPGTSASGEPDASGAVEASGTDADAVYGGMKKYGLRAFAGNFDPDTLKEAVTLTHQAGKKFYVTMNSYPFDDELEGFAQAAAQAAEIGVDA